MQALLDLLYLSAATVASPYCAVKLLTHRKIRAGMKEKLGFVHPRAGAGPCVWFHCVSVGEVGLARELVRRFEQRFPALPAAISTTTDTGRAAAAKFFPDHTIFYYPFDFSPSVNRAIRAVRPRAIVLMELELWPNLLLSARKRNLPVVIVNGRITEKTFRRLSHVRCLAGPLLKSLAAIAVQEEEYASRLIALGADPARVTITGNMKYDTVKSSVDPAHPACRAVKSVGASRMLAGGCTWPGEDEALLRIYAELRRAHPGLGLTLAPKHAERLPAVERLIEAAGFSCLKLSSLKVTPQNDDNIRIAEGGGVVLVDTFGELDAVYAAADVVFVGRSLTQHGGQNVLEPAALGKPVLFGPNTENFKEATALLLDAGAAIRVASESELREQILKFMQDREAFVQTGAKAREVVETRKGATERNLGILQEVLAV